MAYPPAALLCCFADELVEADDWKSRGTRVPGKDVKVKRRPLASHVLALTFFGLRQAGCCTLRLERRKVLGLVPQTVVVLHTPTPLPGWSLEHALGRHVTPGRDAVVRDVVYRMLGHDSADPAGEVVAMAARVASEVGLLTAVDAGRGALGSFLLGSTTLVPVPEAVRAAQPEWHGLLVAWQAFRQTEPRLAHELVTACDRAVMARVESSSDD